MTTNPGTTVLPGSMHEQKDAESSSDELSKPPKKEPNFTLEIPVKSLPSNDSNGSVSPTNPTPFASWSGWVEIENHPMIFSTLLREWGAPSIDVLEVVELDSLFEANPAFTYGLILLSRWTPAETENDVSEAPDGVWFANQVQSYSCATVAIMNIIMNHPQLYLGKELDEFRTQTVSLSPLERGWALDQNDKIRDVHNSFGTDMDKRKTDSRLQEDFLDAEKKRKQPAKGVKKTGRKGRKKQVEEEEENGFHFIAYVPAGGAVWKMDGMERLPRKLGDIQSGDSWLAKSLSDLQSMWEKAMVNQFEVSLMSLVQRTDFLNASAEERQMEEAREDWGPFLTTLLKIHARKGDLKQIMDDAG